MKFSQLFTDDFEAIVEKEKKIAKKKDNNLMNCCFVDDSDKNIEESIVDNMFQTSQKITVEKNSQVIDYGNYFVFLGSILIGLIICILVFEITNRRELDKNDVDIDNRTET